MLLQRVAQAQAPRRPRRAVRIQGGSGLGEEEESRVTRAWQNSATRPTPPHSSHFLRVEQEQLPRRAQLGEMHGGPEPWASSLATLAGRWQIPFCARVLSGLQKRLDGRVFSFEIQMRRELAPPYINVDDAEQAGVLESWLLFLVYWASPGPRLGAGHTSPASASQTLWVGGWGGGLTPR